jgi:cytochrome bd-type quinol oxidase subunit 2
MNSQTRSVTIASLAGLAAGVLVQGSKVITTGYLTPLDMFNPFNTFVLGYWVGALSIFPLIFVIIVIAATARKEGLRNSIFNGLGAVVGVLLVIVCAIIAVAATRPKKELPYAEASADRASFVGGASSSCAKSQRAAPENQDVSAAFIDAFCSCFGNSLADVATWAEVAYLDQHQTAAPSMIEKIGTVSQKCVRLVQGRQ